MFTTLNQIRERVPCKAGWAKLLKHLGKTTADDELLNIATILDSNGLDDALWSLRAVKNEDRAIRLYAVWCARQVQHLMVDPRSLVALDVAERFANGQATQEELNAARAAAEAAAEVAWAAWDAGAAAEVAWAAWDAGAAAAGAAAWAAWAAWAAAWAAGAAEGAAGAAEGAAARDVARDVARDAAKTAQELKLRELCK